MRRVGFALGLCAMAACGHKSSSPAPAPAPSPAASGDATAAQPGAKGDKGDKGDPGATGPQGHTGANGSTGTAGTAGGVQLFDYGNHAIGDKLNDDNGTIASAILFDGKQALINRTNGTLQPYMSFFCLYTANDCTGTCNIYDERWQDVVVADTSGRTWLAARTAAAGSALMMHSYVAADLSCTVNTISTPNSFAAAAYTPPGFTFPLAAPLYWGLAR